MATPADATLSSSHQQGMSPTLHVLEGEEEGPQYGRSSLAPLRQDGDELERRAATTTLPNGVSHDVGVSHGRGPFEAVSLSAGSGLVAEPQVEQRETPLVGAVLPEPELPADAPGRSVPERRNAGRRPGSAAVNFPLFPRFVPSPLPGQSPAEHHRDDHRNQSWFSRIGDYIQRRVEVTS